MCIDVVVFFSLKNVCKNPRPTGCINKRKKKSFIVPLVDKQLTFFLFFLVSDELVHVHAQNICRFTVFPVCNPRPIPLNNDKNVAEK